MGFLSGLRGLSVLGGASDAASDYLENIRKRKADEAKDVLERKRNMEDFENKLKLDEESTIRRAKKEEERKQQRELTEKKTEEDKQNQKTFRSTLMAGLVNFNKEYGTVIDNYKKHAKNITDSVTRVSDITGESRENIRNVFGGYIKTGNLDSLQKSIADLENLSSLSNKQEKEIAVNRLYNKMKNSEEYTEEDFKDIVLNSSLMAATAENTNFRTMNKDNAFLNHIRNIANLDETGTELGDSDRERIIKNVTNLYYQTNQNDNTSLVSKKDGELIPNITFDSMFPDIEKGTAQFDTVPMGEGIKKFRPADEPKELGLPTALQEGKNQIAAMFGGQMKRGDDGTVTYRYPNTAIAKETDILVNNLNRKFMEDFEEAAKEGGYTFENFNKVLNNASYIQDNLKKYNADPYKYFNVKVDNEDDDNESSTPPIDTSVKGVE